MRPSASTTSRPDNGSAGHAEPQHVASARIRRDNPANLGRGLGTQKDGQGQPAAAACCRATCRVIPASTASVIASASRPLNPFSRSIESRPTCHWSPAGQRLTGQSGHLAETTGARAAEHSRRNRAHLFDRSRQDERASAPTILSTPIRLAGRRMSVSVLTASEPIAMARSSSKPDRTVSDILSCPPFATSRQNHCLRHAGTVGVPVLRFQAPLDQRSQIGLILFGQIDQRRTDRPGIAARPGDRHLTIETG